ncbi:hypothetical protein GcM1_239012 [Golovinomyces cichoracearum]|uniref:Uncharacterized protein n=1 Tax=Golovinomyces cichoracearum TaxID=62708 RepID=A0A420IIJ0_9PEZI|nr:hypothetical protein GcM1_239012 [Golovinomyces cichoracearum]
MRRNDRKAADLFQRALKKRHGYWPFEIGMPIKAFDSRVIDKLGYSQDEIFFSSLPGQMMDKFLLTINKLDLRSLLELNPQFTDAEDDALLAQLNSIAKRNQTRQIVINRNDYRPMVQKDRHNTGVRGQTLCPGY